MKANIAVIITAAILYSESDDRNATSFLLNIDIEYALMDFSRQLHKLNHYVNVTAQFWMPFPAQWIPVTLQENSPEWGASYPIYVRLTILNRRKYTVTDHQIFIFSTTKAI